MLLALGAYEAVNVAAQHPRKLRARLYTEDRAEDGDVVGSFFNVLEQDMSIVSDAPSAVPSQSPSELSSASRDWA